MFFSPSTRGFYDPDVHHTIPPDAVEVPAETYAALLTAQSAGATIVADADGAPQAVLPTTAELLQRHRAGAHEAVRRAIEAWMALYTAGVPSTEIASWPTKAEAAAAHLAGGPAAAILIDEALLTGETTLELAGKIAALSQVYTSAVARAAALRRTSRDLIDAAADAAAIDAAVAAALADIAAAAAGQPLPSQSEE